MPNTPLSYEDEMGREKKEISAIPKDEAELIQNIHIEEYVRTLT